MVEILKVDARLYTMEIECIQRPKKLAGLIIFYFE